MKRRILHRAPRHLCHIGPVLGFQPMQHTCRSHHHLWYVALCAASATCSIVIHSKEPQSSSGQHPCQNRAQEHETTLHAYHYTAQRLCTPSRSAADAPGSCRKRECRSMWGSGCPFAHSPSSSSLPEGSSGAPPPPVVAAPLAAGTPCRTMHDCRHWCTASNLHTTAQETNPWACCQNCCLPC